MCGYFETKKIQFKLVQPLNNSIDNNLRFDSIKKNKRNTNI